MGGEIAVESEPGKGSIFSVRLPLALANVNNQSPSHQVAIAGTAMIIASRKACLQELRSLFDRGGITTESILLEQQTSAQIREIIDQNRDQIGFWLPQAELATYIDAPSRSYSSPYHRSDREKKDLVAKAFLRLWDFECRYNARRCSPDTPWRLILLLIVPAGHRPMHR